MDPAVNSPRKVSRWKRAVQKAGLAFGTFVLCVVLLETVLHLAGYGNLEIYEPDPLLYWKLKPNQRCYTKVGHKPVRINSEGTRGPEFSVVKPGSTIRILSLGDSRTFGWGVSEEETYSGVVQRELPAGPGKQVEVINAGVNAWSYPQMLVYFREIALRYKPDFVLVGEANQWTQFSEQNSPAFVKKFMWRVRLKNLLRHSATYHYVVEVKLKAFYERYRSRFIPVDPRTDQLFKDQQQSNPNAVFEQSLRGLCALALTNGIRPVLLFLPTEDELAATNAPALLQVKQQVARELSVPLVDLREVILQWGIAQPSAGLLSKPEPPGGPRDGVPSMTEASRGNALYLEGDPVHFNQRGNELIGRQIVNVLVPLLRRE